MRIMRHTIPLQHQINEELIKRMDKKTGYQIGNQFKNNNK